MSETVKVRQERGDEVSDTQRTPYDDEIEVMKGSTTAWSHSVRGARTGYLRAMDDLAAEREAVDRLMEAGEALLYAEAGTIMNQGSVMANGFGSAVYGLRLAIEAVRQARMAVKKVSK